jgi:hypothetical protein
MSRRGPLRFRPALPALGLFALVTSCGGGSSNVGPPPTPTAIVIASGNRQTGAAGSPLAQPVTAKVTSAAGAGIEGLTVTFAAAANGGSVSAGTAVTDADGTVSATWTLGTTAGANLDTVRASVSGVDAAAVFTATVTAASVTNLAPVSGNSQNGLAGQPLAEPLVVVARDKFGNSASQVTVAWTVSSGGGTISPASSITGTDGLTSAVWTPGNGQTNTAQAVVPGIGTPASFSASVVTASGGVTLVSLSPTPIFEGQTATLTGIGFSSTASSNAVKIGGLSANVSASTATSITVTVPKFNCQPARGVPVQVTVGSEASNVVTQPLNPASFTNVAVGQELVLQDPAEFCLQFAASNAAEDYLIGVQSTSEAVSSLTGVALTSVVGDALSGRVPILAFAGRPSSRAAGAGAAALPRRQGRYADEAPIRNWEHRHFGAMKASARRLPLARANPGTLAMARDLQVGDVVPVRVAIFSVDPCSDYLTLNAVVRVVGTHGIWLEDTENPTGGYTSADFQTLSDLFDSRVYATDVDYFGAPSDIDANGRIAVVITKEVNAKKHLLGFVFGGDLFAQTDCPASNEAEIFYGATPDPTGIFALGNYTRDQGLHDVPGTIAHEFTHIIQISRRIASNAPAGLVIWEGEGQAVLAEEVVGHAVEGRQTAQNYKSTIAFNVDDPSSIDWYSYGFIQNAAYYGFDGTGTKVPGAPEECSWLDNSLANSGPCLAGSMPYGAPWLLLRWLSDQFGPAFPGGEKGLQKAIIESPATGYANISSVVGVPIKTLLAQWAAMQYGDDRVTGLDSKLTLPSWNLFDIYELSAPETARLVPRSRGFVSFTDAFQVRGGSSAYFRVSGGARPATALRVRNSSGGDLPSIMQIFVVRLQ